MRQAFIMYVPDQHQAGSHKVIGVQEPDGAGRQPEYIDRIDEIANIAQQDITQAVGGQVLGAESLGEHG